MAWNPGDRGTVVYLSDFNPEQDADRLYKAIVGAGTDEEAIFNIICRRTREQRMEIATAFNRKHNQEGFLTPMMLLEFYDASERAVYHLVKNLMIPKDEFDARCIGAAIWGSGTDEALLVEVLATASQDERVAMRRKYDELFESMLDAIRHDMSSRSFWSLLHTLLTETTVGDETPDTALRDAEELFKLGLKGLDKMFATHTFHYMLQVFNEYENFAKRPINYAVGDAVPIDYVYRNALYAIIMMVKDKNEYFARRLNKAMEGGGTNEDTLTRILVNRCERDMVQIKEAFRKHMGRTLESAIRSDTSGGYRMALLKLIAENGH